MACTLGIEQDCSECRMCGNGKGGKKMTNHEKLAKITGFEEPTEIEAVKMLLTKIHDDVERGLFENNYDKYLLLYKSQKKWLESERDSAC